MIKRDVGIIIKTYGDGVRIRSVNTEQLFVDLFKDGEWVADRTWDCRSDDFAHTNACDYAYMMWQLSYVGGNPVND